MKTSTKISCHSFVGSTARTDIICIHFCCRFFLILTVLLSLIYHLEDCFTILILHTHLLLKLVFIDYIHLAPGLQFVNTFLEYEAIKTTFIFFLHYTIFRKSRWRCIGHLINFLFNDIFVFSNFRFNWLSLGWCWWLLSTHRYPIFWNWLLHWFCLFLSFSSFKFFFS